MYSPLFKEGDFKQALRAKAEHKFRYSLESDEEEAGRTLVVLRVWPATFFSPRLVYLMRERELKIKRLKSATFVEALHAWDGAPSSLEIGDEVFLYVDEDFLWSLRDVSRADLDKREIPLKADPRPLL